MAAMSRVVLIVLVAALLGACEKEWEFGGAYDPSGSACDTTNPLTGACSCPTDFAALALADAGVTVCWREEAENGWEWGGAFDKTGTTCTTANPRSADCTCPTGFTELFLHEADASLCWASNGTQTGWRYGGAYDSDASGCNTANPGTDDCSCPGGYTALELAGSGFVLCWAEQES
jgi:hypothetical protein